MNAKKVASTFVLVAAFVAAACGKKEGSRCKGAESTCLDKKTALACRAEKFVTVACNGPLGCSKYQDHANCDDSIAEVGDNCMNAIEDEYACSTDKKRALICKNGKFELHLACRGKAGCTLLGQQVSCDTSVAAKGDPCKVQGAVACTEDQKNMVICREGKFETYRFCRGQYGCYMKADAPACDETLSLEGDPCGLAGYVVCSLDGKSELVCQGGRFVQSRSCKKGCTVSNRPGRPIECP
jgi:hypothetical protein